MNLLDQKVFHLFGLPAAISIVPPAARTRFNESRQTISTRVTEGTPLSFR
ncbi:MAG TPA: hypothetical protein VFH46_20020 [Pyrinomonadaceae bacterium]|nr:hypothetical protein [Pyrinomonadaceae bacterium]